MAKNCSFQCAVIDIGSHAVRLDVYEVGRSGKLHLLETLFRPVTLGFDVFRNGCVSPANLDNLMEILALFTRKMREYAITKCRVIATSAIREAFNRELVCDRLRSEFGFELEVLESQQEMRLIYLAMRDALREYGKFDELNAIALVLGAGSLFVSFFSGGLMRFCEEIPLGTVRMYDAFGRSALPVVQLVEALKAPDIPQRLRECTCDCTSKPVTMVALGAAARMIAGSAAGTPPPEEKKCLDLPVKKLLPVLERLRQGESAAIAAELHVNPDEAANLEAGGAILRYFIDAFGCVDFISPGINTRSAVMYDLLRTRRDPEGQPFAPDIRAVCEAIGRRYGFDADHARRVAAISLKILAKLRRDFAFTARTEVLLLAAAILHDIGRFVDSRNHNKHSQYLLANMQLPGISAAEQGIIAATARYHRKSEPKDSHPEYMALAAGDRVTLLKLAAILRVADALDCSRDGKFEKLKLSRRGRDFVIAAPCDDCRAEQFALAGKGGLFTRVFGLELKLE